MMFLKLYHSESQNIQLIWNKIPMEMPIEIAILVQYPPVQGEEGVQGSH